MPTGKQLTGIRRILLLRTSGYSYTVQSLKMEAAVYPKHRRRIKSSITPLCGTPWPHGNCLVTKRSQQTQKSKLIVLNLVRRIQIRKCLYQSVIHNCLCEANSAPCYKEGGGRGSSVGIATRDELDGPRVDPGERRDFLYPFRPTLGPTQPPIQWVPGLSRG